MLGILIIVIIAILIVNKNKDTIETSNSNDITETEVYAVYQEIKNEVAKTEAAYNKFMDGVKNYLKYALDVNYSILQENDKKSVEAYIKGELEGVVYYVAKTLNKIPFKGKTDDELYYEDIIDYNTEENDNIDNQEYIDNDEFYTDELFCSNANLHYDDETKELILDYPLHNISLLKRVPMNVSIENGKIKKSYYSDTTIQKFYESLVYQRVFAAINALYSGDIKNHIQNIIINGCVNKSTIHYILSLEISREQYNILNFKTMDRKQCINELNGRISPDFEQAIEIIPIKKIKKSEETEKDNKNIDTIKDSSELTKDDIKDYYENSSNPKFHRTDNEEILSRNFSSKYDSILSEFNHEIITNTIAATKSKNCGEFNIDEMIRLHEKAVKHFYEVKDFCFSKGQGGKIYFEDYWLHCHNSQNECFNFIEQYEEWLKDAKLNYKEKKAYYDSIRNVKYEIKKILSEKEEVIQKELYKQFLPLKAADIYIAINDLKEEGFLFSEKYLNTRKLIRMTDTRKPTPKWSKVVDGIEPLFGYTPEYCSLTEKQRQSYKEIVQQLQAGKYVEVGDSRAYIFLYAHNELKKATKTSDVSNVKKVLTTLTDLYKDDKIFFDYLNNWLADCYMISKEYDKALELYQKLNYISCSWSLKYKLKLPIDAKEILFIATKNNFTSFAYDKYDKIEKYITKAISNEGVDHIQILGNKYQNKIREFPLFVGIPFCSDLRELNHDVVYLEFRTMSEITEICQNICKEAENLLRQDMGVPKIGEGWISETELYYKIKELLTSHEVIHHYRSKWLGRQHLDVYIPDLKLAFEYQGLQHSKPIDYFGGEKAFLENQKRDEAKKKKCEQENVRLIEVYPDYDFEYIKNIINEHLS